MRVGWSRSRDPYLTLGLVKEGELEMSSKGIYRSGSICGLNFLTYAPRVAMRESVSSDVVHSAKRVRGIKTHSCTLDISPVIPFPTL